MATVATTAAALVTIALVFAAAVSARADTTSWSWSESASGVVQIARADTVIFEGAPVSGGGSQWTLTSGGAAFVSYLYAPSEFNAANTLIGDLAAVLGTHVMLS